MLQHMRSRLTQHQGNRDVVVADCDTSVEVKLMDESERAPEPFCTGLGIANRKAEMADLPESEWYLHYGCCSFERSDATSRYNVRVA